MAFVFSAEETREIQDIQLTKLFQSRIYREGGDYRWEDTGVHGNNYALVTDANRVSRPLPAPGVPLAPVFRDPLLTRRWQLRLRRQSKRYKLQGPNLGQNGPNGAMALNADQQMNVAKAPRDFGRRTWSTCAWRFFLFLELE